MARPVKFTNEFKREGVSVYVKENKTNKSVYNRALDVPLDDKYVVEGVNRLPYHHAKGERTLKKAIITPETFRSMIFVPGKEEGTVVPVQEFQKCIFVGCNFRKMEFLKRSMFEKCVFIDCDFSNTNPYNVAFIGCKFENNNFNNAKIALCQMQDCELCGDSFKNTVWLSRYFRDKYADDPRNDFDRVTFRECDFKDADISLRVGETFFVDCYGPARSTLNLSCRGSRDELCFYEAADKVLKSVNSRPKKNPRMASNPILVDTHYAKMDSILAELESDEQHIRPSRRRPWKNLEGLRLWVLQTDRRYPKTNFEAFKASKYLERLAGNEKYKGRYLIVEKDDGEKIIEHNVARDVVFDDALDGGCSRGSRSIS